MRPLKLLLLLLLLFLFASPALPNPCELSDNGTGTIDLPPACPEGYIGTLQIVDGLPPGSTLIGEAVLRDILVTSQEPGGTLGGEFQVFEASLEWSINGTGDFTGYQRFLTIPVTCEVHTAPRNPGDPVQTFDNDIYFLQGEIFGDPDFGELIITAGNGNGLPSPGSTTITELPSGDFAVDSFFDITYVINFTGAPGSALDGLAGSTIDTQRFQAGEPYSPTIDHNCQLSDNGTGTIDLPAECPEGYIGMLTIVDGLPAGTTLTGQTVINDILVSSRVRGGTLGGEIQTFEAYMYWQVTGTGDLTGYERELTIPIECEMHTGPRNPGDPVQTFPAEIVHLQGRLFGDPDFSELTLSAGSSFGLPSPGSTTLTQLPGGDFAVDSFFDITFEIEFEGSAGSAVEGLAGSTVGTHRFQAGEQYLLSGVGDIVLKPVSLLFQNSPNPFNPMTVIRYELPSVGGHVALDVFDMRGRHVCNLVDAQQTGGLKSVNWNGTDANGRRSSSGVYFYTLKTGGETLTRKMAIIK